MHWGYLFNVGFTNLHQLCSGNLQFPRRGKFCECVSSMYCRDLFTEWVVGLYELSIRAVFSSHGILLCCHLHGWNVLTPKHRSVSFLLSRVSYTHFYMEYPHPAMQVARVRFYTYTHLSSDLPLHSPDISHPPITSLALIYPTLQPLVYRVT